jgi:YHS domain-containing protein
MASQRQRKRRFATILAVLCLLAVEASAATNEQIVSDPNSGLAISGYDPVAYFTDARAMQGAASLERGYGGVVWRFRNEGNLAAFADDPDVYMPRFGGYDPVAISRGASVAGHPQFWLVRGRKLYLFHDEQARAAFAAEPDRYATEASGKWDAVRAKLAR